MNQFGIAVTPGIEYEVMLPMIKEIGFEAFFSHHNTTDFEADISANRKLAEELNLVYETVHSHMPGNNKMWLPGSEGDQYIELLKRQLDACSEYGVPIMITHVEPKFAENPIFEEGLRRFETLVKHAEKKKVKLAFENLNAPEFLFKTLDYFKEDHIGFCYDAGHECCFTKGIRYLPLLGDRILCTHIHDNHGGPDEHLVPFDGTVDYRQMAAELRAINYTGYLTLELGFFDFYQAQMTDREYLQKCYDSLVKIRNMMYEIVK